jgi:hypothetical protein
MFLRLPGRKYIKAEYDCLDSRHSEVYLYERFERILAAEQDTHALPRPTCPTRNHWQTTIVNPRVMTDRRRWQLEFDCSTDQSILSAYVYCLYWKPINHSSPQASAEPFSTEDTLAMHAVILREVETG